jgi:hypothetical protein
LGEGEVLKGDLKKKKALLAWLENTSLNFARSEKKVG